MSQRTPVEVGEAEDSDAEGKVDADAAARVREDEPADASARDGAILGEEGEREEAAEGCPWTARCACRFAGGSRSVASASALTVVGTARLRFDARVPPEAFLGDLREAGLVCVCG